MINDSSYTRVTSSRIDGPGHKHDADVFIIKTEKYLVFGADDRYFMARGYAHPFSVDNVRYVSVEQFYQATKASLFHDARSHRLIMATNYSSSQKIYGRLVANFDATVWRARRYDVMYRGNVIKFTQGDNRSTLGKLLLDEFGGERRAIIYAHHKAQMHWSNGLSIFDEHTGHRRYFTGANHLGRILGDIARVMSRDV